MTKNEPVQPGQIVRINGGKYHGKDAEIRKIGPDWVTVRIGGRFINLKMERVYVGNK